MTVTEVIKGNEFNLSIISLSVFGNARIISDKNNGHRGKRWMDGDYEKIAEYFLNKYEINLEVT